MRKVRAETRTSHQLQPPPNCDILLESRAEAQSRKVFKVGQGLERSPAAQK